MPIMAEPSLFSRLGSLVPFAVRAPLVGFVALWVMHTYSPFYQEGYETSVIYQHLVLWGLMVGATRGIKLWITPHWKSPKFKTVRENPVLNAQFWGIFDVGIWVFSVTAITALFAMVLKEKYLYDATVILGGASCGAAYRLGWLFGRTADVLKSDFNGHRDG